MGVSLIYRIQRASGSLSKEREIKAGWRSMAYGLLLDNGLIGYVLSSDAIKLRELAKNQLKGEREPPFDWAQDISDAFNLLADEAEKHPLLIEAQW